MSEAEPKPRGRPPSIDRRVNSVRVLLTDYEWDQIKEEMDRTGKTASLIFRQYTLKFMHKDKNRRYNEPDGDMVGDE